MARTVADAFNQYHQNYVKPQVESKLNTSAAAATYATQASLANYALKDSPALTGTPTAPTAGNDTDSTQIATTEFVQNLIRRLVGAAPDTLDTLVELAVAINNDPNFAQTIVQALDNKLNKSDAQTTYLGKNDNAVSASRDENGNVIHTTYATKSELPSSSDFLPITGGTMTGAINFGDNKRKIISYSNKDLCMETNGAEIYLDNDGAAQISAGGEDDCCLSLNCKVKFNSEGIIFGDPNSSSNYWGRIEYESNGIHLTTPSGKGLYVNGTKVGS